MATACRFITITTTRRRSIQKNFSVSHTTLEGCLCRLSYRAKFAENNMFRSVSNGWNKFWWGKGILPDRDNVADDIYLRLYIGPTFDDYEDYQLRRSPELTKSRAFKENRDFVLYIHGFIETAQQESVQVMVNAYLDYRPDTNIVLLDWSNMAHGSYLLNAAPNTKHAGVAVAEQIKKMVSSGLHLDKLHVIGHSLGSHVAGYIGRELKKHDLIVPRITALDPAFPSFYPDGVMMSHVCASDAAFVDVIHTDAGQYGAPVDTGHADFWPNGGKGIQPGCPRFAPIPLTDDNLCSHWRSWRFYAESVKSPEAFPASPAASYGKFKSKNNPEEGLVYMGINCSSSARGKYFLTTNGEPPFGKGMEGLRYNKKKGH